MRRYDSAGARKRILSACVRLFLEQGYNQTIPKQIMSEADVSVGSFYNIFKSKSSVLAALCEFMFENQFEIADSVAGKCANGALLYAVETSIQLTIAELNENVRSIYVEVYTDDDLLDYIQRKTCAETSRLFCSYLPDAQPGDFYELEIGSSALMRGFMAKHCDMYFTLERKLERFLRMALSVYSVPEEEIRQIIDTVLGLDIRSISLDVMHKFFAMLEVKFEFKLSDNAK